MGPKTARIDATKGNCRSFDCASLRQMTIQDSIQIAWERLDCCCDEKPRNILRWCSWPLRPADRLIPRWIFFACAGAIYFSAFYSLLFQIKGLIGPDGILPANQYLAAVARSLGSAKYWYAPSLFWIHPVHR